MYLAPESTRAVTYGFGELDTLVPAYAATIHKSQGSEYFAVVIPVMTQHYAIIRKISSTGAALITERLIPTRGAPPKSLARSLSRS